MVIAKTDLADRTAWSGQSFRFDQSRQSILPTSSFAQIVEVIEFLKTWIGQGPDTAARADAGTMIMGAADAASQNSRIPRLARKKLRLDGIWHLAFAARPCPRRSGLAGRRDC